MTIVHVLGGRALLPDGSVVGADLELVDGRIARIATRTAHGDTTIVDDPDEVVDATGTLVAPGLVDIQINGGWGHDFTADPGSIDAVAAELPATGVAAFLPTIVTSPIEQRAAAIAALRAYEHRPGDAEPVGLHFEGPAISPHRRGAHDPDHIAMPRDDEVDGWAAGGVRLVTIAPEVDGAAALIARLTDLGVTVSIGHTACTAEQFVAARSAGASLVTHLFNAMAPFGHREPGPIGATLADATVRAGLICDGIHVDPVAVRMAWRSLGPERFVLVTDAMAALGVTTAATTAGRLASLDVTIGPDGVRLADGTLAGSDLRLDAAVRNLVHMSGCDPVDAIRAATTTPADAVGLADRGRIAIGTRADLVLFDDELHVERTIIEGATAWKS